jgi:hypothetical protein
MTRSFHGHQEEITMAMVIERVTTFYAACPHVEAVARFIQELCDEGVESWEMAYGNCIDCAPDLLNVWAWEQNEGAEDATVEVADSITIIRCHADGKELAQVLLSTDVAKHGGVVQALTAELARLLAHPSQLPQLVAKARIIVANLTQGSI